MLGEILCRVRQPLSDFELRVLRPRRGEGGILGLLVLEQFFLLPKKRFQFGSHRSRAL